MESIKLCVVGDGAVGKSCILVCYTTGQYPGEYVPTIFDNYSANAMVDDKQYQLSLWDTAGQEDYDRLRPLSYPNTDCFIVCYDTTNRTSLSNVEKKWLPELQKYCPEAPIVLVGTKSDMKNDPRCVAKLEPDRKVVSSEEGLQAAQKLNTAAWKECSSLTMEGLNEVFDTAIRIVEKKRGDVRRNASAHRQCAPMCSIM